MQSAFGVEHGVISKAGPTQMVIPGLEKVARVAAPKPAKLPGTGMRMGTPSAATTGAKSGFAAGRKAGKGVMASAGQGFRTGFQKAPGTTIAAASGLTATAGLGAGLALKPNN